MNEVFEEYFSQMLQTIAGDFSQPQQNFLRFVLRATYEDLSKLYIEAYLLLRDDPLQESACQTVKDKLRAVFNLTPIDTTDTHITEAAKARQLRFKQRWRALALSKGIQ
jgi:hypothetical protein